MNDKVFNKTIEKLVLEYGVPAILRKLSALEAESAVQAEEDGVMKDAKDFLKASVAIEAIIPFVESVGTGDISE